MTGLVSNDLLDRVRDELAAEPDHRAGRHRRQLGEIARRSAGLLVDPVALAELSTELDAEITGAGPLQALLNLSGVTDVLVNGPSQVWIDRGAGLESVPVTFAGEAQVRALACRLAAQAGRRLDDATPYVDASMPDGTRLHAILPPLVPAPVLSLRVLGRRTWTLSQLIEVGTVPVPVAQLLRLAIEGRRNLLVSGGTGSGKTTLLAALLAAVAPEERILTIEDARELRIDHPHVVSLAARAPNIEGTGGVDLADLVRQSVRMRADRLVVGEFRGAEVVELLTALNTGHSGAATVHANSAADVPARLTALGALGGITAPVTAQLAGSALDLVVQLDRRDGVRRVREIRRWQRADQPLPAEHLAVWSASAGPGGGWYPLWEELAVAAEGSTSRLAAEDAAALPSGDASVAPMLASDLAGPR